jgi:hypothetical protein
LAPEEEDSEVIDGEVSTAASKFDMIIKRKTTVILNVRVPLRSMLILGDEDVSKEEDEDECNCECEDDELGCLTSRFT